MHPEQLKTRRHALGMTQAAMAMRLGVARETLARWETGVLPIPQIAVLALTALEYQHNETRSIENGALDQREPLPAPAR